VTVSPDTLAAIPGNVTLFASRYMRFNDAVNLTRSGQTLTARVDPFTSKLFPDGSSELFPLTPGLINGMDIGASITTNGGAVSLTAPTIRTVGFTPISVTTGGAPITLGSAAVQASSLNLDAGAGIITINPAGFVQLRNITSGPLTLNASSSISTGIITVSGPVDLTGTFISTGAITSTGTVKLTAPTIFTGAIVSNGDITETASSQISNSSLSSGGGVVTLAGPTGASPFIGTGNVTAVSAPVTMSGRNVSTGKIDTTGAVTLTATAGSIFSTIDNAASVVANSTNGNSTFLQLQSNTALNVNQASATATGCFSATSCSSAQLFVSAAQDVNVGRSAPRHR
jgi:hypothetical protein